METSGERLKKLRLEKGLSLEEVHKKTKIHLSILLAIEGDSLTHLSPVYLQGFVKIYCKFLGVDPKDFIMESREPKRKPVQEAPVSRQEPVKSASGDLQKKNILDAPKESASILNTTSLKLGSFRHRDKIKKTVIWVLVIIVVLFGFSKISKFISSRRKADLAKASIVPRNMPARKEQLPAQKTAKTSAKTQAQEVKPIPKASATNAAPQAAAVNPAKKEDIRLVIKARENCWVTLKTDGKLVFHRVLEKGRSESWKAKERMDLALGNAAAVVVEVDGQIFANLGRKGQALKNIVITKKGMDIGR